MTSDNLFFNLPTELPSELFVTLIQSANVRIGKIISHGHHRPMNSGMTRMSTNG